jgi:hypothetical protein
MMMNIKRAAIVGAVVATLVPALAMARRRVKASKARKVVARATAAARKLAHAPKVRKTRTRRAAAAPKSGRQRVK